MTNCTKLFTWTCHPTSLTGENIVCQLNKSLYGLKQAFQTKFSTFSRVIKSAEFQQSKTDYSLFTRHNNSSFTVFLIYDDILLTQKFSVKNGLFQQFLIKDPEDLKYIFRYLFEDSLVVISAA